MSEYHNPVRLAFGDQALSLLPALLKTLPEARGRVLLLTRGGDLPASPEYQTLLQDLAPFAPAELHVELANPDVADVPGLLQRAGDPDLVIAIGGGTVLDIAKALCAFRGRDLPDAAAVRAAIADKAYGDNPAPGAWIGIPTTSGTGSELTPWAAFWDRKLGLKYSIDHPRLFARAAVIDPRLTVGLPRRATVATAFDALCHAVESYWSKPSNAVSRLHSLEAVRRMVGALPALLEDPGNLRLRGEVAMASLHAGLAFSSTRTTACHSISYPLTLGFGIEHGVAVCLTLAGVMARNEPALIEKEKLFAAFGAADVHGVRRVLHELFAAAGVSPRLRDHGVTEADLPGLALRSHTRGRMDNNPVDLTRGDVEQVLREIL